MTVKADLITLETDTSYAGADAATATQIPGTDTLPGEGTVTVVNSGAKTVTITTSDLTFELENWDFTGWQLNIPSGSYIGKIRNIIFGGDNSNWTTGYAYGVGSGTSKGGIATVERCTFDGGSTLNPDPLLWVRSKKVQNCIFKNGSNDYMKPSGWDASTTLYIQGNFIDDPVAAPNDVYAWSSGTTYANGDAVISSGRFVVSLQNGNLNNALPAPYGSNAYWQFINPHSDEMQADGEFVGPIVVRWNRMNFKPSLRNIGLTAGWWPQPHSTTYLSYAADAYENYIDTLRHASYNISYARCFASPPASWIGVKPKFYNNWLETDYSYCNGGGGGFDWGGNVQFDETAIPYNDAKILGSGAVDYIPPAVGANYPAGGIQLLSPLLSGGSAPPTLSGSNLTINVQVD